MSDSSNIDAFKNDVRYRENIAHIETIPAKKANFKRVDNLNEKIIDYLESKDMKLYNHQAETYNAIQEGEHVIITTPTGYSWKILMASSKFCFAVHVDFL